MQVADFTIPDGIPNPTALLGDTTTRVERPIVDPGVLKDAADVFDLIGLHDHFVRSFAYLSTYRDVSTLYDLNETVYRAENRTWGEVTDGNRYALDQILYYGYMYGRYLGNVVPGAIWKMTGTPLWAPDEEAFRNYCNGTASVIDYSIPIEANAMAILTLNEFVSEFVQETYARTLMQDLWTTINSTLWDASTELFIPQNASTAPAEVAKDVQGLLWGILAGCIMHQNPYFYGSYGTEPYTKAEHAAWTLLTPGPSGAWDNDSHCLFEYLDKDGVRTGTVDKHLKTNALGISALTRLYISSGLNATYLDFAERIYRFIQNYMYNDTIDAYYDHTKGNGVIDWTDNPAVNLEDSAYLLEALNDLYKVTGNDTYHEKALALHDSLDDILYDTQNESYFYSIGFTANNTDKNIGATSLLYKAREALSGTGTFARLQADTNQTYYTKDTSDVVRVTLSYNITPSFNLSFVPAAWDFNNSIDAATTNYILRYPNNTVIAEYTNVTDVTGHDNLEFTLPASVPAGNYSLAIYVNRTGFLPASTTLDVPLDSGLGIIELRKVQGSVIQGESAELYLRIGSTKTSNFEVNFTTWGQFFEERETSATLLARSETEIYVPIQAKVDARTGTTPLVYVEIYNNQSVLYINRTVNIQVTPAVQVGYVQRPPSIVNGETKNVQVQLVNRRNAVENVSVEISGLTFQATRHNVSLNPLETQIVQIPLVPASFLPNGAFQYTIGIERQDTSYFAQTYWVNVTGSLEVAAIEITPTVYQNQKFYVTVAIENRLTSPTAVQVSINGIQFQSQYVVQPGANLVRIEVPPLSINPWRFGVENLLVNISYRGQTILIRRVTLSVQVSVGSIIWAYIFPIVLPFLIFTVYKQWEKKNIILQKTSKKPEERKASKFKRKR